MSYNAPQVAPPIIPSLALPSHFPLINPPILPSDSPVLYSSAFIHLVSSE